ncbi:DUF819 family protein [soil metagenome]
MEEAVVSPPLITNDAIVLGLLTVILAGVFYTSSLDSPGWRKFYTFVPSLLLCYFIPSLFNTFNIISGEASGLYAVASRYLLPASLALLTVSVDFNAILRLGPKAIIMFLTGTAGIIIGGPLAILAISVFAPEIVGGTGPDAVWRGMATIAGSWIGGGANQAAMLEVFGASGALFSIMVTVDVIVANIWMAFLLFGAGRSEKIDKYFKADASAIEEVRDRIENYRAGIARMPSLADTMGVVGVGFGITAIAHLIADFIAPWIQEHAPDLDRFSLTSPFFWIVVIATTLGLVLSFTRVRKLEGVGASRIGSVFLYILVATIGMQMDLTSIFYNFELFLVGLVWMMVHISLLLIVAKFVKAPFFFVAIGSQANVGGAASAPIVASAFHPSLAPVGVLLAVLGYALGTYGAWLCGILMQTVSP